MITEQQICISGLISSRVIRKMPGPLTRDLKEESGFTSLTARYHHRCQHVLKLLSCQQEDFSLWSPESSKLQVQLFLSLQRCWTVFMDFMSGLARKARTG